jgi:hypothetical protein
VRKTVISADRRQATARCLRRNISCWASALIGVAFAGCGSPPAFQFDELDVSRANTLNEFSLGEYQIPVPIAKDRTNDRAPRRNRLRFDFELYALVPPAQGSIMADNWQRHEGKIRDRIIRICRNATLDDLQEPELATLKARLMDALQAELGEREVRRLLMTEVVSREL